KMRAASVLFGLISLWAIWSAIRLIAPRRPEVAVLATCAVALLPMRHAVHSAVGNDAAIECMCSLAMLAMAHIAVRGFSVARGVTLGALVGLAILTKLSGVLLVPGAAVLLAACPPAAGLRIRLARAAWPLALGLVIASPWLALNVQRYGQIMPLRAFHEEFAHTSLASDWIGKQELAADPVTGDLRPAPLMTRGSYSALIANWSARTFLGAYTPPSKAAIGAPSFLPSAFYGVYLGLILLGILGGIRAAAAAFRRSTGVYAFAAAYTVTAVLVLLSFVGFTSTYFQAQGRYLYPVLLPLSLAWAFGFHSLAPARYRLATAAGAVILMVLLAGAFGFAYVGPAYAGR
ncbi:MAG: hypothetical protein FJX72_19695, partial [Armatimonadetes bacterium]|nr:hypothetical protein [Armatimonadota bacterium]